MCIIIIMMPRSKAEWTFEDRFCQPTYYIYIYIYVLVTWLVSILICLYNHYHDAMLKSCVVDIWGLILSAHILYICSNDLTCVDINIACIIIIMMPHTKAVSWTSEDRFCQPTYYYTCSSDLTRVDINIACVIIIMMPHSEAAVSWTLMWGSILSAHILYMFKWPDSCRH